MQRLQLKLLFDVWMPVATSDEEDGGFEEIEKVYAADDGSLHLDQVFNVGEILFRKIYSESFPRGVEESRGSTGQ